MNHAIDQQQEQTVREVFASSTPESVCAWWSMSAALPPEDFNEVCEAQPILTALIAETAGGFDEWVSRAPESAFLPVMEWYTGIDLSAFRGCPRWMARERVWPALLALYAFPDETGAWLLGDDPRPWAEVRNGLLTERVH